MTADPQAVTLAILLVQGARLKGRFAPVAAPKQALRELAFLRRWGPGLARRRRSRPDLTATRFEPTAWVEAETFRWVDF